MIKKLKKLFKKCPIDPDILRLSDCYKQREFSQPQRYVCCLNCKKVFLNDLLFTNSVLCPYCQQALYCTESKDEAIETVWTDKLTKTDFWNDETYDPLSDIKRAMRRIREETGW